MSVKISKRHFLTPVELTDLGTKNPVNKQLETRNLFYFIHKSKAPYW
nr:MAG TPA: hypothetical protein [Caudoviricetes sp.]DAY15311.1 MAG TPA: hypothetical protein [Caudoviricetes sp.]